jgi:hypothetical protein
MPKGYSRSPWLLKGAIIQFSAPMLVPIPNVIIFQYNPETMTRTLTPWAPAERTYDDEGNLRELSREQRNALSQPYDPQETFTVDLFLDACDALEEPDSHPIAVGTGVADRVAALEMLLYPPNDSAIGGLLGVSVDVSIGGGNGFSVTTGAKARAAKRRSVPIVLFFWGPGRIVPVRITTFSVEEMLYSPLLYPLRAKVNVGMRVLDDNDMLNIEGVLGPSTASVKIAKACYTFTRVQKELLATANIANSVESILSLIPS